MVTTLAIVESNILLLMIILLICLLSLYVVKPILSVYFLILFYPLFSGLPNFYLSDQFPAVNLSRIFIWAIVIIFILKLLVQKEDKSFWDTPFMSLIITLCSGMIFATIFSYDKVISIKALISFLFQSIVVFFAISYFIKSHKEVYHALKVFLLCAVIIAVFGIIEFMLGKNPIQNLLAININWSTEYALRGGYARIASFIGNPVGLGNFLILTFTFFLFNQKNRLLQPMHSQTFFVFILFLILATAFLSLTRGVWLAGILVLAIYPLMQRGIERIPLVAIIFLFIIFIIIPDRTGIIDYFQEEVINNMIGIGVRYDAVGSRWELLKNALDYFYERPLFGYGLGVPYYYVIRRMETSANPFVYGGSLYGLENDTADVLLSVGICGAVVYYIFLFGFLFKLIKHYAICVNREHAKLYLGAGMFIISYIILGFAVGNFPYSNFLLLIIMLAIINKSIVLDVRIQNKIEPHKIHYEY